MTGRGDHRSDKARAKLDEIAAALSLSTTLLEEFDIRHRSLILHVDRVVGGSDRKVDVDMIEALRSAAETARLGLSDVVTVADRISASAKRLRYL